MLLVCLTYFYWKGYTQSTVCVTYYRQKKFYRIWFSVCKEGYERMTLSGTETCPLPRATTWHTNFQLSSYRRRQLSAVDGCDSHVSGCNWVTSIRKREGSDTQLTQIENQQLSHESWAARDRLQNHMGQQSLVPQNNERFPVLQADDLHTFWSTLVPALAEWEISHTVAIKLTHLNSESNVISSSFLVFMPRNNPEHHNAKFQGVE